MPRGPRWFLALLLLAAPLGAQQPLRGDEAMPSGHPPVAAKPTARPAAPGAAMAARATSVARGASPAASASAAPGHGAAPAAEAGDLPAGHPPVANAARPQREPEFTPPPDRSAADK